MKKKIIKRIKKDGVIYTYYVTEKDGEYGVEVVKNIKHRIKEKSIINKMYLNLKDTFKFCKKLIENNVTPCTLKEIVEDTLI